VDSGDGWTICAEGHRHWGRFGAAGVLIAEIDRVVLQHRAPWTHEGGRWGIPGGARNHDETAVEAALREAWEEAALEPSDIEPLGVYVDDHGGWSYSTVVSRPRRPISPMAGNAESVSVEWIERDRVDGLPLHDGFAAAWPTLRDVPTDPVILVADASLRDEPLLADILRHGIAVSNLPSPQVRIGLQRVYPRLVLAADPWSEQGSAGPALGSVLVAARAEELRALAAGPDR
jgi:8-oxo-dGTP pyrophosphatase MutT (NUDIX family)